MGDPPGQLIIQLLFWTDRTAKALHVVQAVFYFLLIYRILRKNDTLLKNVFSYGATNKLNWLFSFNLVYSLGTLAGVAIIFIPQTILEEQHYLMDITLLFLTGFTIYIGMKGIDQQSIGKLISEYDQKYKVSVSPDLHSGQILEKVNNYLIHEKAFLKPELKIWDIVLATGINRTYISRVINQDMNMSFNHYINKLRIEEAIKLLEMHKNRTLESIALDSGFNSISTFKRAFHRFTGKKVSEYRETLTGNMQSLSTIGGT
jgi:AraC-like DNA-binding protein